MTGLEKFDRTGGPFYLYRNCNLVQVVDGDTIDVRISVNVGFHQEHVIRKERIRLVGINTPEVVGAEKPRGIAARGKLQDILIKFHPLVPGWFSMATSKGDKFGRWLGILVPYFMDAPADLMIVPSVSQHWAGSANEILIQEGHATEYWGEGVKS